MQFVKILQRKMFVWVLLISGISCPTTILQSSWTGKIITNVFVFLPANMLALLEKGFLFSYFHHRPDHLTWIAPKLCDRWDWIRFRGHLRAPLVLVIFLYSTHLASLLSIIMPNVKMSYQHTCPTCYLLRHERAFSSPITTMKISFFQTWYLPRHGPASFTLLHQLLPQHLPEVRSFFFSLTQGGRSWQPFGEGKNGHEDFCQARKCKFANSTQYNM